MTTLPRAFPLKEDFVEFNEGNESNENGRSVFTEFEIESRRESFVMGQLSTTLHFIESFQNQLLRANEEGGYRAPILKLLDRYETQIVRLCRCLRFVHFEGRQHLLRDIQHHHDRFHDPSFQVLCSVWNGTPGVEEIVENIKEHWKWIQKVLTPLSKDDALRQLVQYATPSHELSPDVQRSPEVQSPNRNYPQEPIHGVVNVNVASSGADANAIQKSSQELQQELRLAQRLEAIHSQEARFETLLKDLNASSSQLISNIDQAQNAKQAVLDASQESKEIINELKSQNAVAQQICETNRKDWALSRGLTFACASIAFFLGVPKLRIMIPLLKRIPFIQTHARTIERWTNKDTNAVAMNLIRERHMYKRSYEVLQELVEIQQTGNLFHKLAFGILGLGRTLRMRMEGLAPPSDMLYEHERWIDVRPTPYGPPQWSKASLN